MFYIYNIHNVFCCNLFHFFCSRNAQARKNMEIRRLIVKVQVLTAGIFSFFIAAFFCFTACGKEEIDTDTVNSADTVQHFDTSDKPYDMEAENLAASYKKKSAAAMAQLQRAMDFAGANGIEKLIGILNNPDDPRRGSFVSGNNYVWIFKTDFRSTAVVVAHPINRAIKDRDFLGIKDADGKLFIKDIIRITSVKGKGWVTYSWSHPVYKKAMAKLTFSQKLGDYIICAGFYLDD